jgi:hypothetical protein
LLWRPILDNLLLTVACHAFENEQLGDRQEEAQIQVRNRAAYRHPRQRDMCRDNEMENHDSFSGFLHILATYSIRAA